LTLMVRASEIQSTANGSIYLGAVVRANGSSLLPSVPALEGATLVASNVQGNTAFALYKVDSAGLQLLRIAGATAQTAGTYTLELFVAGDANRDGIVDGTDAALTFAANGSTLGQPAYQARADANLDGKVDATDSQLLFQNLGYRKNVAPVVLT